MKYIKLFEEQEDPKYSIFDLIAMTSEMAGNSLRDDIMNDNPDKQCIEDIFQYTASGVNSQDEEGNTALMWAVRKEDKDIIQMILDHPDFTLINTKNNESWTVLATAVTDEKKEIVEILLQDSRIDINIKSNEWTPLHYAVNTGNEEIIMLLLMRPDINKGIVDDENKTPWDLAWDHSYGNIRRRFPELDPNYNP